MADKKSKRRKPSASAPDGYALAQAIETRFGGAVDDDIEIDACDAVDFVTQTLLPMARAILDKAEGSDA